jgi:uncharacterized protein (TIGR00369 family)
MNQTTLQQLKEHYLKMISERNFDHFIAPKIITLNDGEAEIHWQANQDHLNRFGAVHGGALAGLIDTVGAIATLTKLKRVVTTELSMSFLKAADISTKIIARGRVLHFGRTLIRTEVSLFNEQEQLLTLGRLTFFVLGELNL